MAVEQKRVSDMPIVPDGQLGSFDVFGWNKTTNESGRAPMSKLKGDKGNSVELRETSTHVQWREVGTTTWNNLIPLADLVGETGASIEMQASSTHIQWRVQGSTTWINLISIEALRGNPGKSAYELWLQQPGNAGKPYSEYEAYNREPATAAKNEWNVLKPEITNKITEAGEAAEAANTSASNADSKAGLANTAATNANTAASEANTAKEGVLDAIDNANDTAEHPTYIGTDFYVYKWDKATKQYVKTDIFVKGSAGAGNVDIINSPTVKKDVPYVIVPTDNEAQTYNAVEADYVKSTEFDTHNSDSTRHITSSERTAWNAKGSSNLALGETSATAYRGDRGKIAYDHSQSAHAPANAQKNSDITKAEIEAKLTGVITTHTHAYVPTNSFAGSTFTANVIPLDNPLGAFRVATASNATTYTLSTTKVIGAWAKILVNRATAPTVTGGTLIKGSDFKPSTNMYLYVMYDGTKSEYYFAEI